MITQFCNENPQISISRACKTLVLSRSTYYYFLNSETSSHNAKGRPKTSETYNTLKKYKVSDTEILQEIENILTQKFVLYGYKKTTAELKKRGYVINHKKVYRLMKEKGLLLKRADNKNRKRDKEFSACPTAPDQKWSIDIKTVKAANGDIGYVIATKDCYTKEILSVCVERRHTAKEIENALYQALANRNLKEFPVDEIYIVSDNGKEIIKAMRALKYIGIKHFKIPDILENPEAILIDIEDKKGVPTLLYIKSTKDKKAKFVIKLSRTVQVIEEGKRKKIEVNLLTTAGLVKTIDLKQKRYILLQGKLED